VPQPNATNLQAPAGFGNVIGFVPAGRTWRLIVLFCWVLGPQVNTNVQQPAVGTSVMLGPPAMVTTG
jgi:hypothetical protein